jgi:hypothetical protein
MEQQFQLQDIFSVIRNLRLMLKFNLLLTCKGKPTVGIADSDLVLLNPRYVLEAKSRATDLKVDVSGYLDELYDDADLSGCNNDFCLNQCDTPGVSGNLVTILRDDNKQDYVVLVVRSNAPGVPQVALPSGFKRGKEAPEETCKRGGIEETGYVSKGTDTRYYELSSVTSKTWDPRPAFGKAGTINHGLLRYEVMKPTRSPAAAARRALASTSMLAEVA